MDRGPLCGPKICLKIGTASEVRATFLASKTGLSLQADFLMTFQVGFSVAVLLCSCVGGPYVVFVLSLRVPQLIFFQYPGKTVLRDCGISWSSSLIQLTLIISKSMGLSEILQDIRTSTYQICRIEENINREYVI